MPKKSISRVRKTKSPVRKSKKTYKMDKRIQLQNDMKVEVSKSIDPIEIFRNRGIWGKFLTDEACLRFVRSKITTLKWNGKDDDLSGCLEITTRTEILMFFRTLNLPNFPMIVELKINVPMDNERMAILASALATNALPHLASLKLFHNNIDDGQAIMLANALQTNTTLVLLGLSNNNIGDIGALALVQALAINKTLKFLNISHNRIGDDGANALKLCIYGYIDTAPLNNTIEKIFMINNPMSRDLENIIMLNSNIHGRVIITKLR